MRMIQTGILIFLALSVSGVFGGIIHDYPPILCERPLFENYPSLGEEFSVLSASIVFRHGDRHQYYSRECWPNDKAVFNCQQTQMSVPSTFFDDNDGNVNRVFREKPVDPELFAGNCQSSELTEKGYRQHVANGQYFRSAYDHLLKDSTENIHIRSTKTPRTIASASAFVEGLYPSAGMDKHEVAIHTKDMAVDILVPNPDLCHEVGVFTEENAKKNPKFLDFMQTVYRPLTHSLASNIGMSINATDPAVVMDCSTARVCHGQPVADGLNIDLIMQARDAAIKFRQIEGEYPSPESASRIRVGFMHQAFVKALLSPITDPSSVPRVNLFSGHDLTIANYLMGLDAFDGVWPPYASVISLELVARNGQDLPSADNTFVRLMYNDQILSLPGCDVLCPTKSFLNLTKNLLSADVKSDCNNPDPFATFKSKFDI